jgi:CheY-like chemotaxis protein
VSDSKIPRTFIVDDEHVIATTLAVILQNDGFSTKAFTDPLEDLTSAESDPPDLVISDVMMPGITGSSSRYKSKPCARIARSYSFPVSRRLLIYLVALVIRDTILFC